MLERLERVIVSWGAHFVPDGFSVEHEEEYWQESHDADEGHGHRHELVPDLITESTVNIYEWGVHREEKYTHMAQKPAV